MESSEEAEIKTRMETSKCYKVVMIHETEGDGEYMKGGTKTHSGGNNYVLQSQQRV